MQTPHNPLKGPFIYKITARPCELQKAEMKDRLFTRSQIRVHQIHKAFTGWIR